MSVNLEFTNKANVIHFRASGYLHGELVQEDYYFKTSVVAFNVFKRDHPGVADCKIVVIPRGIE